MILTQKESMLIEDLKNEEKICIEKYQKHSNEAKDQQLKDLFSQIMGVEKKHLSMLDSITDGTVPTVQSEGGQSNSSSFKATYNMNDEPNKLCDAYLCSDLLATEKHASGLYDTCVFEFKDQGIRDVLNHIQKEEQNHGKKIYDYMSANSMYS